MTFVTSVTTSIKSMLESKEFLFTLGLKPQIREQNTAMFRKLKAVSRRL